MDRTIKSASKLVGYNVIQIEQIQYKINMADTMTIADLIA